MTFESLRGFRDYLPPDAGARSEIRRRMRSAARRCGFTELESPSVESLELFKVKSGEEIGEQVWAFTDRGGRAVALVAETTPSLARIFVDRAKSEPLPVKWFTVSKLWRYEEPQAGRTREFSQFNLDLLGVPGVEAEAEILATAALVMDEVGAEGLYAFRINDRKLVDGIASHFGVTDLPKFYKALDRALKVPRAELADALRASGLSEEAVGRFLELLDATATGSDPAATARAFDRLEALGLPEPGPEGLKRLRALWAILERLGLTDRVAYDPVLVRGLAYYTSLVFEAFERTGEGRSLFGGGRYDQLIELFGGPSTPACGLGIGDQTLEILLRKNGRWPAGEPGLDTYVVAVTAEEVPPAIEWVQKLRRSGVSADCDLMGRSLSKQLKEAARRGARRALILGPKEIARGVVVERDMATGTQRDLSSDTLSPMS